MVTMEAQAKKIAELLKNLANENRLLILCELLSAPRTVGKLCERIPGISQSAMSQHLALLKAHGILDHERSGQNITYFIADPHIEEIIAVLKKNYCPNLETPKP